MNHKLITFTSKCFKQCHYIKNTRYNNNTLIGSISRSFSSSKDSNNNEFKKDESKVVKAPDNFYDEDIESDKVFLDMAAAAITNNGVKNITTAKKITWDELWKDKEHLHDDVILPGAESLTSQKFNSELAIDKHYTSNLPEEELSERIEELFDQKIVADMGSLNYNNVARTEEEFPEPLLEDFVSDTAPEKFRIDRQDLRSCPGKRQRKGQNPYFKCHKIDLDEVNPFDIKLLEAFLTEDSEIMSKKKTGLCTRCQRKVAKTIKHSRNLGLLPHLGEFQRYDPEPLVNEMDLHKSLKNVNYITSKTILK